MMVKWAKVGFTGTRRGTSAAQWTSLRQILETGPAELHHGNCVGADTEAHQICLDLKIPIVMYPTHHRLQANGNFGAREVKPFTEGKDPELRRNCMIVDATDLLIACPREFMPTRRSGVWHTVRQAQKKGRPIIIIYPDGRVER
jgi:hypothetical protein